MRWRNNTLSYAMSCNSSSAHCWFKELIKTTVISWWATFHVCDNKRLPICHIQHLDFWSKPPLDLKLKLLQWFGLQYCNGPPCAGHFYALAFDSPLGNSKVTGSRWTHSSTYTLWWSTRLSFKKNYQHTAGWSAANSFPYLLNLCSGPNPLWHRAILLLTTGLPAASKTGRAGSRLFITSCLWNIDFVASGLLTGVWEIFISRRMVVGGILWACFIC